MRMEKSASAAGVVFEPRNQFKNPMDPQQLSRFGELGVMISPVM